MQNQIGMFYLYYHRTLLDKSRDDKIIDYKTARYILTAINKLPKPLTAIIIKEMENLDLIERQNKMKIKIINPHRSNIVNNIGRMYKKVGMW